MIKKCFTVLLILVSSMTISAQFNHQRAWATYFGNGTSIISDDEIDSEGNVYLVGSAGLQFMTTPNAYQTVYGGEGDGFIAKFSPNGVLHWATYFGGASSEELNGISIDNQNNIYVVGRTKSAQGIATQNAFQSNLLGTDDGFLAQFTSSGNRVWSTYYGGSGNEDDLDAIVCDANGNLFVLGFTNSDTMATQGTFQTTRNNNNTYLISSFTNSGNRNWASYYGINDSSIRSIGLNDSGLYVYGQTDDASPFLPNTYFATTDCHQSVPGDYRDAFLSKFTFDGQRIWSTYYGGLFLEWNLKNNLICSSNAVYITGRSSSSSNIATAGAFQINGSFNTPFLVKFTNDGVRQWGTYCGKTPYFDGTYSYATFPTVGIDDLENIYLSGGTGYLQNIASTGSYQDVLSGTNDAFIIKFNTDGERLWGTYYGGSGSDSGLDVKPLFYNNSFYIIGSTNSLQSIATAGSYQPNFINTFNSDLATNIFMAKFDPLPLNTIQFSTAALTLYPNPNNGKFVLKGETKEFTSKGSLTIYDALGRKIKIFAIDANAINKEFDCSSILSSGVYTVKLKLNADETKTCKMIVN